MTKPDYKFMHVILNQCLRLNAGKAMFSVFLYFLIQFIIMGIAVSPAAVSSLFTVMLALAFLVGMNICSEVLLYGLFVIMARFIEKKYVTIGFLFIGFRKNQKPVFRSAIVFTAIYASVVVVLSIAYFFCKNYFSALYENLSPRTVLSYAAIIVLSITMLVSIPFSFVRLILYKNNEIKVLQAFKKSMMLMKGRFFHFIGFVLYACGRSLIQVIIIQFALIAFSAGSNSSTSILLTFLSIAGVMAQYRTLTRLFVAIPIYYYTLTGVIHSHKTEDSQPPVSSENGN